MAGRAAAEPADLGLGHEPPVALVPPGPDLALAVPAPQGVDAHAERRRRLSERKVTCHSGADGTGRPERPIAPRAVVRRTRRARPTAPAARSGAPSGSDA